MVRPWPDQPDWRRRLCTHTHTHTHTLIHCLFLTGDISDKGKLFRVSTSHFQEDLLPHLTSHDAVICLCSSEENGSQLQDIMKKLVTNTPKMSLNLACTVAVLRMNNPHGSQNGQVASVYFTFLMLFLDTCRMLSTPAKCGLLVLCAQSNSKLTQPKHLHSHLSRRLVLI